MNNILPLLAMLSMSKGNGLSADTLAPVMKALGIDDSGLSSLLAGFSGAQGEMPPIEKLLPLALSAMNKGAQPPFAQPASAQKNAEQSFDSSTPNYLKPICDIADERINYALAHYFSNN